MTALEAVRPELEQILQRIERDCAMAVEAAAVQAAARVAAERQALIDQGRQLERDRTLLLIALQLEHLREDGTNAIALHSLRRAIRGEAIDG